MKHITSKAETREGGAGMLLGPREDYLTSSAVLRNAEYLLQFESVPLGTVEDPHYLQDTPDFIEHCILEFEGIHWHF